MLPAYLTWTTEQLNREEENLIRAMEYGQYQGKKLTNEMLAVLEDRVAAIRYILTGEIQP